MRLMEFVFKIPSLWLFLVSDINKPNRRQIGDVRSQSPYTQVQFIVMYLSHKKHSWLQAQITQFSN